MGVIKLLEKNLYVSRGASCERSCDAKEKKLLSFVVL